MLLSLLALVVQGAGMPATPPLGLGRADANRDGVVTRAEAQATADARFARIDTDRDGTVTPDERRAFRDTARLRPITAAEFQQRAQARFARLDTNRDGVLSGDERRGDRRGRRGRHGPPDGGPHAPGDRHGPDRPHRGMKRDGSPPPPGMAITAAQFRARALARFDRLDANRDGRLDANELVAGGRGSARPGA